MYARLGRIGRLAIVSLGAAVIGFSALSGPATFAKNEKSDQTPSAESTKKPGQSCDQFKKDSADYKKCVEAQAKEYKK